jgi:hypothetical protein
LYYHEQMLPRSKYKIMFINFKSVVKELISSKRLPLVIFNGWINLS